MKRKILVISASAGAGHTRAADAVTKIFQQRLPDATVEHIDLLKHASPFMRWLYSDFYLSLAGKWPLGFRILFEISDKPEKRDRLRESFERANCSKFFTKLREFQPDIIVATHFSVAALVASARQQRVIGDVKTNIVVTDFDIHGTWLTDEYERYFVANEKSAAFLHGLNMPSQKVFVSGIPVDAVFAAPMTRADACVKRSLDPTRKIVLVSTGGFGVGPVATMIEKLLRMNVPAQIVAIAGKSEPLKRQLDQMAARHKGPVTLIPVGFTREMHEYMAAADILIGKPGGLTSSEAIARGLPMCIINPIPGQEERNADRLLEAGAAIRCHSVHTLSWQVESVLHDNDRLARMRAAAASIGKPHAANMIVDTILRGE